MDASKMESVMRNRLVALLIVTSSCGTGDELDLTQQQLRNGNCHWEDDQCVCVGSPIVIDLDGDGFHFTGHDGGVPFALTQGRVRRWSWMAPGSDDAWLALPGSDGVVNNGSELFGNLALQPIGTEPNGFTALSMYDDNSDGRIDALDEVYPQLRLWIDQSPRDGFSQPAELITLESAGVRSIAVTYAPSPLVDAHGNEFRYVGDVDAVAPVAPLAYDVFLLSVAIVAPPIGPIGTNTYGIPSESHVPGTWSCTTRCRSKTVSNTLPGWRVLLDECRDFDYWKVNRSVLRFDVFVATGLSGQALDGRQVYLYNQPTEAVGIAAGNSECVLAAAAPLLSITPDVPNWGPCEVVSGTTFTSCSLVPAPTPTGGGGTGGCT